MPNQDFRSLQDFGSLSFVPLFTRDLHPGGQGVQPDQSGFPGRVEGRVLWGEPEGARFSYELPHLKCFLF